MLAVNGVATRTGSIAATPKKVAKWDRVGTMRGPVASKHRQGKLVPGGRDFFRDKIKPLLHRQQTP